MKNINKLAVVVALLAASGAVLAQSGPEYVTVSGSGKFLLNSSPTVSPTPGYTSYLYSTDGGFYVSGYRYTNGAWEKVFPKMSAAATDTAVYAPVNFVLPVTAKVDALCIVGETASETVHATVYK